MYSNNLVCFRYIILNTLLKSDDDDDDDNNNNNNNNNNAHIYRLTFLNLLCMLNHELEKHSSTDL
jgi:hypothetical protein